MEKGKIEISIREAKREDVESIMDIYNEAVLTSTATFDTSERTLPEQQLWFTQHEKKYPVLVAVHNNTVCGWAALSKWSDKSAYDGTAELSVYVLPDLQGRGIGKDLMEALLDRGRKTNIHTILSRITKGNQSSMHLHRLHGFKKIGVMKSVGYKFGKFLDVFLLQFFYSS